MPRAYLTARVNTVLMPSGSLPCGGAGVAMSRSISSMWRWLPGTFARLTAVPLSRRLTDTLL